MKATPDLEQSELDKEWILLIQTAQMMGLSSDEVRLYLTNRSALTERFESELAHATT